MKQMGTYEVKKVCGLHPEKLRRLRESGKFPEPVSNLRCGPIWLEKDVRKWMAKR